MKELALAPHIQVDMFEVQLGAAMLVQMRFEGKTIRILADAGIVVRKAYPREHVHDKLTKLLGKGYSLDLIIATHYDADHLEGLVPIIQDQSTNIKEIWLPPVAGDFKEGVAKWDVLAESLAVDKSLETFLRIRRSTIKALEEMEGFSEPGADRIRVMNNLERFDHKHLLREDRDFGEPTEEYFRGKLEELRQAGVLAEVHCGGEVVDGVYSKSLIEESNKTTRNAEYGKTLKLETATVSQALSKTARLLSDQKILGCMNASLIPNLRLLQAAACKDSINAYSLDRVMRALRARTRIDCDFPFIRAGHPETRYWQTASGRFEIGPETDAALPKLTMLGPSESLIAKHRHRLPHGLRETLAALLVDQRLKSITPSNQLSLVVRASYKEQGVLISGDAGFVDWKEYRFSPDYYPDLIAALLPLHVVQVAHHGGNNAHFYRVLERAKYPGNVETSFMLLSHAVDDPYRPSPEFGVFLKRTAKKSTPIQVLFTSQPNLSKVKSFRHLVSSVIGGAPSSAGDVQLRYEPDGWKVLNHAIQV